MTDDKNAKTPPGNRTPPASHRFQKGISGNPKGRPRKKTQAFPPAYSMAPLRGEMGVGLEEPMKTLAMSEAYRMITIREGDRVEKIPAIQAVLRGLMVSAAKGNPRAQKMVVELLGAVERDRSAAKLELLQTALEYKENNTARLKERARRGVTGPDPVPHPDDVIIDMQTGEVRIDGPILQEQKDAQDALRAQWLEIERSLAETESELLLEPDDAQLLRIRKAQLKILDWLRQDALKQSERERLSWSRNPDEADGT